MRWRAPGWAKPGERDVAPSSDNHRPFRAAMLAFSRRHGGGDATPDDADLGGRPPGRVVASAPSWGSTWTVNGVRASSLPTDFKAVRSWADRRS
jgi:hypothetical protein